MKLTAHALEHIQGRTKMLAKDVLSIVENNAGVELGTVDGFTFLLFFSPPDNKTKIAIVSSDKSLVSVWDSEFNLPDGIRRPNIKRNRRARDALKVHILARSKKTQVPDVVNGNRDTGSKLLVAKIRVLDSRRSIYVHDCGLVREELSFDIRRAKEHLGSQLEEITTVIGQHEEMVRGSIRYHICYFDPNSQRMVRSHNVSYKKIKNRLQTV